MIRPRLLRPDRALTATMKRRGEYQLRERALRITDRRATAALQTIRAEMRGSGLGRLGNALGAGSDLKKGGRVDSLPGGGFRVSGWIVIRSRSERAIGAITAYTEGAEIAPVRGRWLWLATDEIPQRAGRYRMTPARYRAGGFEQKIGPLQPAKSVNGYPLLVVKNVGVSAVGRSRSARNLKRNGQPRKGQRLREFLVAFVAIPRTSRAQRVAPRIIIQAEAAQVVADLQRGN